MDLAPGQRVDRYVVEELLGKGAMATVWRVRHTQLGTPWAIKVLHVSSVERRERLLLEGRIQSGLRHPNVVTVFDVIEVGGASGLVLELVDGPTLEQWQAANQPTVAQADHLARGILAGVAAAHAVGLVHRDLKPGNILLQPTDGSLVPKVTDFGLAKVLEDEAAGPTATRPGRTMGSPCYMAPEQIRDTATVDARADVFALGVLLYELLAGRRPFDGPDNMVIFERITRGEYASLGQVAPDVPRRMQQAVAAALSVDPDDRPATVQELATRWTDGHDVLPLDRPWEVSPSLRPSPSRISQDTFDLDAPPALGSTDAPAPAPDPPTRSSVQRLGPLAGLGLLLLVGAAWFLRPAAADVPRQWSADPTADRQCSRALDDLLRAELRVAERGARSCVEVDPESAAGHLLLGLVLNLRGFDAESLTTTRRASDLAGPDHPDAALIALAGSDDEAAWQTWLDDHPADPFGHVLWAAGPPEALFSRDDSDRWAAVSAHHPDPTLPWVQRAHRLVEAHRLQEAEQVVADGLSRDPSSTALGHVQAQLLADRGDWDRASAVLDEVLDRDPAFAEARLLQAWTRDLAGQDEARDDQLRVLFSEETPLADRIRSARRWGPHQMGMGRDDAAFAILDDCLVWAEGKRSEAFACIEVALRMANWVEDADRIEVWLARHERALAMPEFPTEEREQASRFALRMHASLALRRGDVSQARAHLDRYDALPGNPYRASIHVDVEAAEGRTEEVAAQYADLPDDCQTLGRRGRILVRAGADSLARAHLEKAVDPATPCDAAAWDRWVVAHAHVDLAELLLEQDPDKAREHLDAFFALFDDADADLPLVLRAQTLWDALR